MNENEKEAREIIERILVYNRIYNGNIFEVSSRIKYYPKLTDEECWSISTNLPVSFQTIRNIFPK